MGRCVTCGCNDKREDGGPALHVYNLDMRPSRGTERDDDVSVFCEDCALRHHKLFEIIKERTTIVEKAPKFLQQALRIIEKSE